MKLSFAKMQGLGNDFVVLDGVSNPVLLDAERVRRIADRRFGIGCDQVLIAEPPNGAQADFFYRIYNADGSQAEQCGNGARCLAKFVRDHGLAGKTSIRFQTVNGVIETQVLDDTKVAVNMGVPSVEPGDLPFLAERKQRTYRLECGQQAVEFAAVSMGNPHAVIEVSDVMEAPVEAWGRCFQDSSLFPRSVNVGFMQILASDAIALRVYERGAGETPACGTGACAAVVAGRLWARLDEKVAVDLRGGRLMIEWQGAGQPLTMTGPAETVFEGAITL